MKFDQFKMFALVSLMIFSVGANATPLITPKESKLPDAAGSLNTRGISRGPSIKIVSPELGSPNKGPFEFKVDFEARGGATIDKSSVKVTYMKSPIVDLTPRVRNSITDNGIDFKNAEIPPGEHQIKILVKDSDGRESSTITTLVGSK